MQTQPHELVIGRDWYVLGDWHLNHGRCAFCDTPITGHFDAAPGTWGSRRLPVRIDDVTALA